MEDQVTAVNTRVPRKNAAAKKANPTTDSTSPTAPDAPTLAAVPEVTGYDTDLRFYATRYKQGGRTVYTLDLSLAQIQALIPKPDPATPTPGNRAIRPGHAQGFAKYIREHDNWIAPAMILRSPAVFNFDPITEVEGAEFGVISFPRQASSDIHILDGQHRTLGIHLAEQGIALDLDKARSSLASARRVDPDGVAVVEAQRRVDELARQRERLNKERVSLQIFIEDDAQAYKQMFFDIADNALGITASVKARFDTRKVVNRALEAVLEHPLLQNRVDHEADRVGRGSPYLMGAKHVAEIVRSVQVGLDGRVSRRQEHEFKEKDIAKKASAFFDLLVESFPQFKAILLGQLLPDDLRKTSVLGSVLMIRVLAGAFHDLIENHAFSPEMVGDYFSKLSPHMAGPVHANSIWMTELDGVFSDGGMAPHGRRQDLKALRAALVAWAIDKPAFLEEGPKPRPKPEPTEKDDPEYGAGYIVNGVNVTPPLVD